MEVIAAIHLEYCNGKTITGGDERLDLIVKFKEEGEFLKTKLIDTLVTTSDLRNKLYGIRYDTYEEYLDDVEKYLNDYYLIKKRAEEMVLKYFKNLNKERREGNRRKSILKRVNGFKQVEIKVKIN